MAGTINTRRIANPDVRIRRESVNASGWNILTKSSWKQERGNHWPLSTSCGQGSNLQEPTTQSCRLPIRRLVEARVRNRNRSIERRAAVPRIGRPGGPTSGEPRIFHRVTVAPYLMILFSMPAIAELSARANPRGAAPCRLTNGSSACSGSSAGRVRDG